MQTKYVQTDWKKENSFKNTDPWTIMFVYPLTGEPFIIKGGVNSLEIELAKYGPCVSFYTMWHKGKQRGSPRFVNLPVHIRAYYSGYLNRKETYHKYPTHQSLVMWNTLNSNRIELPFKRIPRCFPYQLKDFITNNP